MEKEIYNNDRMVRYLLGSLSEEETERVEELSFVDDEFAVQLSAVENDLVDNYVRGRLSGEKLERFDSYYLASPKRRIKVENARILNAYAENAVATGKVVFASGAASAERSSPSISTLLRGFFSFPRLILNTAVILVLVGIGLLLVERSRLRSQLDQAQATRVALEQHEKELQAGLERKTTGTIEKESGPTAKERHSVGSPSPRLDTNTVRFNLLAMARTDRIPSITLPSPTDYLVLQVELDPDDSPSYNAVLLSLPDRQLVDWKSERLKSKVVGGSRAIEVVIPATILQSQEYLLVVTGISGRSDTGGERGFRFRVLKQ